MEHSMEDVIKQIIQIDKNAGSLKNNLETEIKKKQQEIEAEIEKLRTEIVIGAKEEAKRRKEEELKKAAEQAEKIVNNGKVKALELQKRFEEKKEALVTEIFKEII